MNWKDILSFSFSGRLNRVEFLLNRLFILLCVFILGLIGATGEAIAVIYILVVLPFGIAGAVRRLHDLNLSGWYVLLVLIPIVNIGLGLYCLFAPGTLESNKYGEVR